MPADTLTDGDAAMTRLQAAIAQKQAELQARAADLRDSQYPGKEWAQAEMEKLNTEVANIQAYIEGRGTLVLALCLSGVPAAGGCLLAHRQFDGCAWRPQGCGFSYKQGHEVVI